MFRWLTSIFHFVNSNTCRRPPLNLVSCGCIDRSISAGPVQGLADLERALSSAFRSAGPPSAHRPRRAGAATCKNHANDVSRSGSVAERVNTLKIGALRVGMLDVGAVVHFPEVLRTFRSDFPDIRFHLPLPPQANSGLRRSDFDLIVCVQPLKHLRRPHLLIFLKRNSSWFGLLTPGHFPHESGVLGCCSQNSQTRTLIERRLRDIGASPQVVAESHQPDVLAQMVGMVRVGCGQSSVPRTSTWKSVTQSSPATS